MYNRVKQLKTKAKENILKATKKVTFKGEIIRLTDDYSTQNMETRRYWNEIFQMLKENTCQSRIPYLANTSFQNEHKI